MNGTLRVLIVGALSLLGGCGTGRQSLIVGKWEVENSPAKMTAEFNSDGTAKITIFGQTAQGKYQLDSDNQLVWTMNGRTTKAKANITATELELTDDQNRTIKYSRK